MTSARFLCLFVFAAVVLTACDLSVTFDEDVEATGDLVTLPFDVESFTSISVENTFDAFIEVGEPASVEIIVNESVVDELDIRVRNGELQIALRDGISINNGTLEATITIPSLEEIDVSGASSTDIIGLDNDELRIDVSGSSDLVIEGSASVVHVDGSGASNIDLRLDGVDTAEVDLSGASSLELQNVAQVIGDLSGASDLTIPSDADVEVSSSGASSISRR